MSWDLSTPKGAVRAVAAVVAVSVLAMAPACSSARDATTAEDSTTTTAAAATPASADEDPVVPSGQVAYVTDDRRVWVGEGVEEPIVVGTDAALTERGQAAVAIAPTADLVAYIRRDGALVTAPVDGGAEPTVVATDAVTTSIGEHRSLSWGPIGDRIAYLAVGTADMVPPAPATPGPIQSPDESATRIPIPNAALGNVVKIVQRSGEVLNTLGDPSTRSMSGVEYSMSDDFLVLESLVPGAGNLYTVAVAAGDALEITPTPFSADDPAFSPDGNFLLAVGPDKSGQELVHIALDSLQRTTLVSADEICNPSVSPDSTRIAYGTGPGCSELQVISARGGVPVDITPPDKPGRASFEFGQIGWTAEGHYVVFADCRSIEDEVRCGGPTTFLDPDVMRVVEGPPAGTVAPVRRPLVQDVVVDLVMEGPIEYAGSFVVDSELQGEVATVSDSSGRVEATFVDGETSLGLKIQMNEQSNFATGQITVVDPDAGIDRTFMILGSTSVIGVRIAAVSGIWVSTEDLPVASGKFRLAIRRA